MISRVYASVPLAIGLAAMSTLSHAPQTEAPISQHKEQRMNGAEITIRETTQPTLSGHLVGVSNIWRRELPDERGAVAPRLSATVSIVDLLSRRTRTERIIVGSVLSLGVDRYYVVRIEEGESSPGAITLRQLLP